MKKVFWFFFSKKNKSPLRFVGFLLLCALSTAARAEEVKTPDLSPPDTWLPRQEGKLRLMNKIDSTVQVVALKVGETVTFQSLKITLGGCFVRPPDLPADAAAHVTIVDTRPDQPGYNNWILLKEPGLNMFEHPVYDMQLAGCE